MGQTISSVPPGTTYWDALTKLVDDLYAENRRLRMEIERLDALSPRQANQVIAVIDILTQTPT